MYAVDKGSVVKDYMGYVKEDYNFDFDHLDQLTVGGKALSMYQEATLGILETENRDRRIIVLKWYMTREIRQRQRCLPGI